MFFILHSLFYNCHYRIAAATIGFSLRSFNRMLKNQQCLADGLLLYLTKLQHIMRFGLQHPNFSFDYDGQDNNISQIADSLKNLITKAENSGFDSFWVMDHFHQIQFVGRPEEPMLEGWSIISVLAGITTKIKLGTLVTGIIYRYPSVLAKIAATLDVITLSKRR